MPPVPPPERTAPVSRWLVLGCALALLAGALWLHREALLFGQVYHMDDAADGYYPSHVAETRALHEGTLATWERGAWCGWPLANDPYYGVFYPLSAFFWVAGAVRGLGLTVVFHVLLAGLGMGWLLRRRRLDVGPALLGAASLAFSSFMVVRIRHVIFVQALAWLPFILVGVEGWLATRKARELGLAALATGMMLLCGALPLAPYLMLIVLAYVAPRLLRDPSPGRALLGLCLAAIAGGLLGAAQWVPTVAHLPESPRSLATDFTFASTYAWPDARYLGTLLVPNLFGGEERSSWFGAFNHWEMAGYYAGALAVALAPFALFRWRRPELWSLAGVAALAGALAFGAKLPVHGWFFRHVPLYAALRCPTRALVMFLFAAPLLAAEGLSWLFERAVTERRVLGAVLALGWLLVGAGFFWTLRHPPPGAPPPEVTTRAAFAHLALVLSLGFSLVSLAFAGLLPRRGAAVALALVALVDLVSIGRGYVEPRPADWASGTERFAALDWLLTQHPDDRFIPDAHGPFRLHNAGMTYGIENAGGYDSVTVWRMVNLLYTINHGAPYPWKQLKDDLAAGTIQNPSSPLVDLMNVRWAIAPALPAPGWIERFRPKPGASPHAVHEASWDARLAVYENPHPLPRAFVVYEAEVIADGDGQARALAALDPRQRAILEVTPDPEPLGAARPFSPARLVRAERHALTIDAEASAPGVLVVSETFYPGWSATVDGKPAPLLRADYAFRGVALTAGHHLVEMRFHSRPTRVGLGLSAVGLIGVFALFGVVRPRRRRGA